MLENVQDRQITIDIFKNNLLKPYINNELIKKILLYTYHPFLQYYFNEHIINNIKSKGNDELEEEDSFFDELDFLSNVDDPNLEILIKIMNSKNKICLNICKIIINKHIPRFKLGSSLINNLLPDLLPKFQPQEYNSYNPEKFQRLFKKDEYIIVEPFIKGTRCLVYIYKERVGLITLKGNKINGYYNVRKNFESYISRRLIQENCVFDCILSNNQCYIYNWIPLEYWWNNNIYKNLQDSKIELEDMMFDSKTSFLHHVRPDYIHLNDIEDVYIDMVRRKIDKIIISKPYSYYHYGKNEDSIVRKIKYYGLCNAIKFHEGRGSNKHKLDYIEANYEGRKIMIKKGLSKKRKKHIWDNRTKYRGLTFMILFPKKGGEPKFIKWTRKKYKTYKDYHHHS